MRSLLTAILILAVLISLCYWVGQRNKRPEIERGQSTIQVRTPSQVLSNIVDTAEYEFEMHSEIR